MKNNQYLLIKFIFCFIFGAIFLLFNVPKAFANIVLSPQFGSSPPANYILAPAAEQSICGAWATTCWNSASVGSTDCGTACAGGDAWTKYNYSGCYYNYTWFSYLPFFRVSIATCSTGDKYNSGNKPIMKAGACDCSPKGDYKTCCNGTTLVDASHYATDPFAPDEADCGGATTIRCDGAEEPTCGQDACDTLATPSCTPGTCDALEPACGTTTYGSDGCSSCHKDGAECSTGCTPGDFKTVCTTIKC